VYLPRVDIHHEPSQSRLAVLHAVVYATGMLLLLSGLFARTAYLLLLAGPFLAVSGALIWVGTHITLTGPVGGILRGLLGRPRVATMHLRAVFWMLLGVLVTLWGVASIRSQRGTLLLPEDPVISLQRLHVSADTAPRALLATRGSAARF
jgi:hypothetical protein